MPGKMARSASSTTIRATRRASSRPHRAAVLREAGKSVNIYASLGVIREIPAKEYQMCTVKYLFVTGCARSGTSVMTDLLRAHPKIAMGRERFAGRYLEDGYFPPSLFERERFCRQLREGDSHHQTLSPYYEDVYHRFDQYYYRGDKIPEMATNYAPLLVSYSRPKVVYMLRNCFDVADSFNRRAIDAKAAGNKHGWPWDRDSTAAVEEWNVSLRNTLGVLDKIDVLFVIYERLFVDDIVLNHLFDFLDLPVTDEVAATFYAFTRVHQDLESKRRIALTSLEKLHITRNADWDAYRRVLCLAEAQVKPQHSA
jgi:hypothetical protein